VFAVGFSARNTFYVGFQGDAVTIFRGRPGGVLWIDPTVEERTDLGRDQLSERLVRELDEGKDEDSLDSAREYVDFLREEAEDEARSVGPPPEPDEDDDARDLPRGVTTTVETDDTTPPTESPP
jgi:hypothetical protein